MAYQYNYEIVKRPAQVGGGVRLYLYGPNPETGEQVDYGSAVFLSDLADPRTLKDAYIAAQQKGDLWMESQREDISRAMEHRTFHPLDSADFSKTI